jgi:hypothetical protein
VSSLTNKHESSSEIYLANYYFMKELFDQAKTFHPVLILREKDITPEGLSPKLKDALIEMDVSLKLIRKDKVIFSPLNYVIISKGNKKLVG